MTESTLPIDEIERERGVIIQEIGQSLDTPDDLVFDLFAAACYEGHSLGRPILGTVDSVSRSADRISRRFCGGIMGQAKCFFVLPERWIMVTLCGG